MAKVMQNEKEMEVYEEELYDKLTIFCKSHGIKTKRVNEKISLKGEKDENKWRYPDVVGFKDIALEYDDYTQDLMTALSFNRCELYSFEVKRDKMTKSKLREAVLEVLGNSLWANRVYLVAEGIDDAIEDNIIALCKSYKIGFICLNRKEPEKSEILLEAPRRELDWITINELAKLNDDFQTYTKYVVEETKHFGDENTNWVEPDWDTSYNA